MTIPVYARIFDKDISVVIVYWIVLVCLWAVVEYVTDIDVEEIFGIH